METGHVGIQTCGKFKSMGADAPPPMPGLIFALLY